MSSTPRTGGWVPNGQVNAVVTTPTTIYLGGEFTCVSPYTGGGVPLDIASGSPTGTFPEVNGFVYAVSSDGSGGWYIGGEFSEVGGVSRSNICRILADGSVDPAWNPSADGIVRALVVSGGTVFAAGEFTSIGGEARSYVAALDASTGVVGDWNPNSNGYIEALCLSGNTLYAAGWFSNIGGEPRSRIAALDASTGDATAWDPGANSAVCCLAVADGTVFAGGYFTSIGGESRSRIAALSAASGAATVWNPGANSSVSTLAVSNGVLFAGGSFSTIGGQSRNNIAALDIATGALEEWNPGANASVYALAVSGGTLYVGGEFSTCGGEDRNCLAAVDIESGAATAWDPTASSAVHALAVSGSILYAGGAFNGIGGVVRGKLAALDAATGIPTDWNPDASGVVYSLAVSGNRVYAGGVFSQIGGQSREFLAALDATTGAPTEWAGTADNEVLALCSHDGVLYVGGGFSQIGGVDRSCIAALDPDTGNVLSWNPNSDGSVYNLLAIGDTIYAGGSFYNIGGQFRIGVAALNISDGTATAFSANTDDCVYALVASNGLIYAGGNFTSIGGEERNHLAALNPVTGAATSWDPNVDGCVYAVAASGSNIYAGGDFWGVGGTARTNLALIDATTATLSEWSPNPDGVIRALTLSTDTVGVAGAFARIGGVSSSYFAQFDCGLAAPTAPGATAVGMDTITWTWSDNSDEETGYNIYVEPGSSEPSVLVHTTAASVQSWQQQSLASNTQYAFQAAATNGATESQRTANYTAWTLIEPVQGLTFTDLTPSSVAVCAENNLSNLTGGDSGMIFQNLTQVSDSGWQQHNDAWTSSGLQPNTAYTFTGQSRNGTGLTTTAVSAIKYTLAAVPAAPMLSNPTIDSIDVSVGAGDGNPVNTEYAFFIQPAVAGKSWVQAAGSVGANPVYQTAAAWAVTTVSGLSDDRAYTVSARARNSEGAETGLSPSAVVSTLPDLIPSVTLTLLSPPETGSDEIEFQVELDEVVVPEFSAAVVVVNGLAGTVSVTGGFPLYTVFVHLSDPDADGAVSIMVPADLLYDGDSNACSGGTSEDCRVYNWHGFAGQPTSAAAYMGDSVAIEVTAGCGANTLSYSWKWDNGRKSVVDVGTDSYVLLIDNVTSQNEGTYWCEVSYDANTYPSSLATVSVSEHLNVSPLEPQSALAGDTCTFTVSATGGYAPLTYTWTKDGAQIPGANQSSYTTDPLAMPDSGSIFTVTVADSNTDLHAVSTSVTVTPGVPAAGPAARLALVALLIIFYGRHILGALRRRARAGL